MPFELGNYVHQWRMMFYIEKAKNVPINSIDQEENFILKMNFSDIHQSFHKRTIPITLLPFLSRMYSSSLGSGQVMSQK